MRVDFLFWVDPRRSHQCSTPLVCVDSNRFISPLLHDKISAEETSGDEFEVNKMSHGGKWGNNNFKRSNYSNQITATGPITSTKHRKADQVNMGTKGERLKNHSITGILTFCSSEILSSDNLS